MQNKKEYFQNLINLLDIEEKEDNEQYARRKITNTLKERIEKGITWYPVKTTFINIGIGNKHLIGIEKIVNKEMPHSFWVGNMVSIFNNTPDKSNYVPLSGLIKAVGDDFMHITIDIDEFPELPDWLDYGSLGIEKEFNMPTYKKMKKAMSKIRDANGGNLSRIRDVILKEETAKFTNQVKVFPTFDPTSPFPNASQKLAIIKVLQAKDIAIIHGPPGTGKTTTMVEAISWVLANEEQVLVTAPSNAAVDLLAAKIGQKGIKVLRLGNPERIGSIASNYTLDTLISFHKDAFFFRAIEEAI